MPPFPIRRVFGKRTPRRTRNQRRILHHQFVIPCAPFLLPGTNQIKRGDALLVLRRRWFRLRIARVLANNQGLVDDSPADRIGFLLREGGEEIGG